MKRMFTKYLVEQLLEQEYKPKVAIYPGSFEPPTASDFEAVEETFKKYPSLDKFIVYVGGGEDGAISPESAVKVWQIYAKYLPKNFHVFDSKSSPVSNLYKYADNNPDEDIIWIQGGKEDDADKLEGAKDYPNIVSAETPITSTKGKSADVIAAANTGELGDYLPFIRNINDLKDLEDLLKSEQKLSQPVTEVEEQVNPEFDLYEKIMDFMSDNGMKLDPRPTIDVIDDDRDNAEDFFGKTAYYDPNNNNVVLYTLGRHPKDVARSFAHELVHCHQNNEGRLEGIGTTNTNEDDYLEEIEREAYETGNIMFRKWSDSIKK